MADEHIKDAFCHGDRDREPDPGVSAERSNDDTVDAHDFTPEVYKRASRTAGIDGGIGLDQRLFVFAGILASQTTDNAQSGRLP